MSQNPIGKAVEYPVRYAPERLCAVPRSDARGELGLGRELPFHGQDVWNCYELTWLDPGGKPVVAIATLRFPADSPCIVESKSMKLYLTSLSMTRFGSETELVATIRDDLAACSGGEVDVGLTPAGDAGSPAIEALPGDCIDAIPIDPGVDGVDASLLAAIHGDVNSESLHSHLLRSNCPVTGQPDSGSVLIRYRGRPVDRGALLRYLVSYRQHSAFHEACVERMFLDIRERCETERLTVYARYNRRGGIDINPFRSDFEDCAGNPRLWRQ